MSESDSFDSDTDDKIEHGNLAPRRSREPPYENIEIFLKDNKYPDNMKNDAGKKRNC